jgi:predicted phosphoribosyltransferase
LSIKILSGKLNKGSIYRNGPAYSLVVGKRDTAEAALKKPIHVCLVWFLHKLIRSKKRYLIMLFRDRLQAGRYLATKLSNYANRPDTLVLALPRGGVPVAFEIAKALNAPLDVFIVRKLGVPGQEELAMGATATGKVRVLNEHVIRSLSLTDEAIEAVAAVEERELERREQLYRGDRPPADLKDKTVILVDDGLATGSTMRAAVLALKRRNPARIVVAVPVAAASTCDEFKSEVDDLICAVTPEPFLSVGQWYDDFSQTSDQEVQDLLRRATRLRPSHVTDSSM